MQSVGTATASKHSRVRFWIAVFLVVSFGVGSLLLAGLVFAVLWFRVDRLVLGDEDAIQRPTLRIVTGYPGASAEVVEQVLTLPLETQLNGLEGMRAMRSVSREGESVITIQFASPHDIHTVRQSVLDRVRLAQPLLPADIDPPRLALDDPDALPLAWLVLTSKQRSLTELSALANERVRPATLTVPGVGGVEVVGAVRDDLTVRVDPDRLRAFALTLDDVLLALRQEVGEPPRLPGRDNAVKRPADLLRIVVSERGRQPIRLADVAVLEASERASGLAHLGGRPAVALGIHKTPGFDAASAPQALRAKLAELRSTLPDDVELLTAAEGPVVRGSSNLLLLDIELAPGMRPRDAAAVLAELEKRLADLPECESVLSLMVPSEGFARPEARCFVSLRSANRRRTVEAIQADARKAVENLPAARATVHQVVFRRGRPARKQTFEVVVEGEGIEAVSRQTARLRDALAESGVVTEVRSDDVEMQPWAHFSLKREQAARLGVGVQVCLDVLAAAQGGLLVGDLETEGRKHTVFLELGPRAGQGADVLRGLAVRGLAGRVVALAEVLEVQQVAVVPALYRHDGKRGARITGNVAPDRTAQQAWEKCQELAGKLGLLEGGGVVPWNEFRERVR